MEIIQQTCIDVKYTTLCRNFDGFFSQKTCFQNKQKGTTGSAVPFQSSFSCLLHTEADAVALFIHIQNHNLNNIANFHHFTGMAQTAVGNL